MTGRVETADGKVYELPALLEWRLRRTGGVPCDSFRARCLYSAEMGEALKAACRFAATENGVTRFRGVIDEWSAVCGAEGAVLTVEGRGMAALLLDNEAEAVTYQRAALSEILKDHAAACGVAWEPRGEVYGTGEYAVASGSSRWKAIEGFARRCGLTPYFTREGVLCLRGAAEALHPARDQLADHRIGRLGLRLPRFLFKHILFALERVFRVHLPVQRFPHQSTSNSLSSSSGVYSRCVYCCASTFLPAGAGCFVSRRSSTLRRYSFARSGVNAPASRQMASVRLSASSLPPLRATRCAASTIVSRAKPSARKPSSIERLSALGLTVRMPASRSISLTAASISASCCRPRSSRMPCWYIRSRMPFK